MPELYQWFISDHSGLHTLVLAYKRHQHLTVEYTSLLVLIGKVNMLDIFTMQLQKILEKPSDYMDFINTIFGFLLQNRNYKEQVKLYLKVT